MNKTTILYDKPIPSCVVERLVWNDKNRNWSFEYSISYPENVTVDKSGIFSKELYVYGHIQQLKLVDKVTKGSINISVKSIGDVLELIHRQYKEDMIYRNEWIKNNPDYYDNVFKIETKNKTQKSKYNHIVFIHEIKEESTIFIAAPQKEVK